MEHHGTSWIIKELRIECRLIMIDPWHLFRFFLLFSLLFSLFYLFLSISLSFSLFLSSSLPNWQLFTATLLSHQTPLLSAGISIKSPSIWYLVILARVAIFFGTFSSSLPRWFCARPLWAKHGHILVGECGGVLAHRYVAACYMFRYMKMHPCLALVLGMFRTLLCILANTVCSSSSILYRRYMKMHRHSLWHPGLFAGCLYLAC